MPRSSAIDMLPAHQKALTLRKYEYVRDTINANRGNYALAKLYGRMAESLNVTESTISQVVNGRNKNPFIINALYDELAAIFGGDSTIATHRVVSRLANPNGDRYADLRERAKEARARDKELFDKIMGLIQTAREINEEHGVVQKLWRDVDARLPASNDHDERYRISNDDELYALIGGFAELDRVHIDDMWLFTIRGLTDITVRYTTEEDFNAKLRKERAGAEEFLRQTATQGVN